MYDHIRPPSVLPTTSMRGSNRKFNFSWLIKYPWLPYSPKLDGGPCAILLPSSTRRDKGLLVNRPYSNWSKLSSNDSLLGYHRNCLQDSDTLKL